LLNKIKRGIAFRSTIAPVNSKEMQKYIPLILAVVATNALSQILLKQGMNTIGRFDFQGSTLFKMIPVVGLNPYVIGGLLVLVFSMGLHLVALSRVELSFAYPFLSISYVVVLAAGYLLFGETINISRIFGVVLICVGTIFIARS
jgi:multidrug transporter EmrE-like cation transporter